jgi:hypothetical protein
VGAVIVVLVSVRCAEGQQVDSDQKVGSKLRNFESTICGIECFHLASGDFANVIGDHVCYGISEVDCCDPSITKRPNLMGEAVSAHVSAHKVQRLERQSA